MKFLVALLLSLFSVVSFGQDNLEEQQLNAIQYNTKKQITIDMVPGNDFKMIKLLSVEHSTIDSVAVDLGTKEVRFEAKDLAQGRYYLQFVNRRDAILIKPLALRD